MELRIAWQANQFIPLASTVTAAELIRALCYPKFALSSADREDLLADYLPWVSVVDIPKPPPHVPTCRDPFDTPFLELAVAGSADVLVSGDRDLLALSGVPGLCPIVGLAPFCEKWLKRQTNE